MAASRCGACGKTRFELNGATPTGCRSQINFIQCAACGAVVGVGSHSDIASVVANVAEQLAATREAVEERLARIEALVRQQSTPRPDPSLAAGPTPGQPNY